MFAIIATGSKQYKVAPNDKVIIDRLSEKEGDEISLDKVLLTVKNKKIDIGAPYVKGVKVLARVVKHLKGEKLIIFKYKSKKRYKKKKGFRASLTEIEILNIGPSRKPAIKKSVKAGRTKVSRKRAKILSNNRQVPGKRLAGG